MSNLTLAKDILERLEAMGKTGGQSIGSGLSELQELIDKAGRAVEGVYQAEQDMESMNSLLTAYERGGAA